MDTSLINLLVFDSVENFDDTKQNLGEEKYNFKTIKCIDSLQTFNKEFNILKDDELVFMVIHAFSFKKIKGIKQFIATRIKENYPKLGFLYISEGDSKSIKKQLIENDLPDEEIYKYHKVQTLLEASKVSVFQKKEILKLSNQQTNPQNSNNIDNNIQPFTQCDYALITALEEDEMEAHLPYFVKEGTVNNDKHLIEFGHLKDNKSKKIVYASQQATGMVDASILATELIVRFKPKFLIMSGVLGGKPKKTEGGNIIVSNKVFTIDKGKLTANGFDQEIESSNTESAYITKFKREKTKILRFIQDEHPTIKGLQEIFFEPIACVRQVVNRRGYFAEKISSVDRKTLGLEMESYGIARACELLNNGNTIPIIVKSVMDNTQNKSDDIKKFAAWTSATFIRYILKNNLI